MRNSEEIKNAIEVLKKNRLECSPTNYFGQNNHESIDVMIDVIENNRSEDWIYTNYPSCDENGNEDFHAHGKWQSAMSALNYLRGNYPLDDLLYPTE